MEEIVLLSFIVLLVFVISISERLKKKHLKKSKLLQKKIKVLQSKKMRLEEKNDSNLVQSTDVKQMANQVLDLHKMIFNKYVK